MAMTKNLESVRVALYVRVSTQWQIDKDSLPVQRDELTAYAKYVLNADFYEIFEDAGYSAKNTDRPGYQQMMARIRTGEFSHLLVWKLDRISRNLLDFASMYDELKRLGVVFVSKNEQFDTSSAMGEAMLKIILVFAELERKMTSERVSAVMIARAGNGKWNGGKIPFGYDYDKETETFSVNKNEAKLVLMIYDLYEKEHSLLKVTRTLNESGYRHRNGNEWSPTSVSIILNSMFYTGAYRYNYYDMSRRGSRQDVKPEAEWVIIEHHHPAIVEKTRWQNVVLQLQRNRRETQNEDKTYSRKNVHVFAGLLICGCCGKAMSATSSSRELKGGYRPSIYACSSHRKNTGCPNKYVSDKTIGPFILNYISNMIKAYASFGKSTSPETLQKKLLRGEMFAEVDHLKESGLMELYALYKTNVHGEKYPIDVEPQESKDSERELLLSERRRLERALSRLKALYLYSEADMAEKDYIIEKNKLDEQLEKVNARLEEVQRDSSDLISIDDDEFMQRASRFVLSQKLQDKRYVNFERLIGQIDPRVLKDFINSVSTNFCIKNGRVTSITFKNGIIHEFVYKDE